MVNILRQREITVIELGPEYSNLNEESLGKTSQQLIEVAKHSDPPLVVIDLSHTNYFSSYFIQFLIRTWKLIKKRDGKLVLAGLQPECLDVLKRCKIDALWERFPNRDLAIDSLQSSIK